jgi:mannose-1-phosphate guanylyltransferase
MGKGEDQMSRGGLWSVILAGGEGKRLRPFLRYVQGTERPKQFCAIIGTRSMLRHTVDRARWLTPAERTVTILTAGHRPFVAEDLAAESPRILLEQPLNRDTAPGILLPLQVILRRDPEARVVLFPSDHFVLEEGRFWEKPDAAMAHRRWGSGVMACAAPEGRAAVQLLALTAFYALVFGGILLLRRMARADVEEWHR